MLLLLLLLLLAVAVYLLGNAWFFAKGILNNWVFLPEDINCHYKVIEMLFNHPRKMRGRKKEKSSSQS